MYLMESNNAESTSYNNNGDVENIAANKNCYALYS